MGRFDSTVEFYARYREPYPAQFFREVADRLQLKGAERLIDIGSGPAPLAIGFAPYVGSCTALDVEPEMIASAGAEAARAGVLLELIQSRIEDLPSQAGTFDLVTVGRALHWFDREQTLAVLDRCVAPGGAIAVCSALAARTQVNPWAALFHQIRLAWASDPDESCYHVDFNAWFEGSRFHKIASVKVADQRRVAVPDLIHRALSMSNSSPAVLGDRRAAFEANLAQALEPFAENGLVNEVIEARAFLLRG